MMIFWGINKLGELKILKLQPIEAKSQYPNEYLELIT